MSRTFRNRKGKRHEHVCVSTGFTCAAVDEDVAYNRLHDMSSIGWKWTHGLTRDFNFHEFARAYYRVFCDGSYFNTGSVPHWFSNLYERKHRRWVKQEIARSLRDDRDCMANISAIKMHNVAWMYW